MIEEQEEGEPLGPGPVDKRQEKCESRKDRDDDYCDGMGTVQRRDPFVSWSRLKVHRADPFDINLPALQNNGCAWMCQGG
jgi:hypothetical protein